MEETIKKHVNFKSMFYNLYQINIGELTEYREYKRHYNSIIEFVKEIKYYDVSLDDCEIDSETILFGFYQETISANESNPDSDGIVVLIEYNRNTEEFVSFQTI